MASAFSSVIPACVGLHVFLLWDSCLANISCTVRSCKQSYNIILHYCLTSITSEQIVSLIPNCKQYNYSACEKPLYNFGEQMRATFRIKDEDNLHRIHLPHKSC